MLLDNFLGWAVIAFPFLLAIAFVFIPTKSENESDHMKWRIGLLCLGAVFSLLARWQQSRSLQEAKQDRDDAIAKTSAQVTKDVTELIGKQYKSLIDSLTSEIATLKAQLSAQGKDVSAIKSSNIVTGRGPIKVEVAEQGANINWNQEQTALEDGKPTVTVNFRVDNALNVPAFVAICDRPCKPITASAGVMSHRREITWPGQPNLAGTFFDMPKPLPAGTVCTFRIASADDMPVRIQVFRILKEIEVPMELM